MGGKSTTVAVDEGACQPGPGEYECPAGPTGAAITMGEKLKKRVTFEVVTPGPGEYSAPDAGSGPSFTIAGKLDGRDMKRCDIASLLIQKCCNVASVLCIILYKCCRLPSCRSNYVMSKRSSIVRRRLKLRNTSVPFSAIHSYK
jgi:hypothetical protein